MPDEYLAIATRIAASMRELGLSAELVENPPSDNPSANVDVESADVIGRVTIWKYGESFFEALECRTEQIIYSKYLDIDSNFNLEMEVRQFCKMFRSDR